MSGILVRGRAKGRSVMWMLYYPLHGGHWLYWCVAAMDSGKPRVPCAQ